MWLPIDNVDLKLKNCCLQFLYRQKYRYISFQQPTNFTHSTKRLQNSLKMTVIDSHEFAYFFLDHLNFARKKEFLKMSANPNRFILCILNMTTN